MKTYFLSAALLVAFVSHVAAQPYLSIKTGAVISNLKGDSPPKLSYASKVGYQATLLLDIPVATDFYLSTGAGFIRQGTKLEFYDKTNKTTSDSATLKFDGVVVPLLFRIISNSGKLQYTGGFEVSIPTSLSAETSEQTIEIDNEVADFGVGLTLGIGRIIPISRSNLVIDLNYVQGLVNMAENIGSANVFLPRVKSYSWRLSLIWMIPLGKEKNESDRTP